MERFWSKVNKTDTCWLWTAATDRYGYGSFYLDGRVRRAHRVAYELLVGPIPEGLDLDHVKALGCSHRACVNPDHLEPVTRGENLRRGGGVLLAPARNRSKTHCPKGHAYDEENTYLRPDRPGRGCRRCIHAAVRRHQQRKRVRT